MNVGRLSRVATPQRFKAVSAVLVSRFAGTAFQLGFTVLVARALGADGAGYVFTWLAWSIFAAALLSLGTPAFVVREVAAIRDAERLAMGRLYLQISLAAAAAALAITAATALAPALIPEPYRGLALLAVASGHAILMLEVASSALIAMRRESVGIFLRFVGPPLAMCLLLLAFVAAGSVPSIPVIVAGYVGTALCAAAVSQLLYRRWTGSLTRSSPSASATKRRGLWSINVVNALHLGFPFLVLPYFADAREIAFFAIGYRIGNVAQTAGVALASYFSPRFARAHRNDDVASLRKLFVASQALSLVILAPLLVFLTPLGPVVLRLFGSEFAGAWAFVAIPAGARLLIAGCGLTEQFLAMTHNERIEIAVSLCALLVLAPVGLAAVRSYGALGLCVAFYGVSVLKYAVTCLASLAVLYRPAPLATQAPLETPPISRV
jgi:O-antigen/teichoic acid export membrane protein